MPNYFIIEGIVTEIKNESSQKSIRLSGTEGFSIRKREGNRSINMNVFCSCDIDSSSKKYVENNKVPSHAIKIPEDYFFNISEVNLLLCSSSLAYGKKIRLIFTEAETSDNSKEITEVTSKKLKIISLSLLA